MIKKQKQFSDVLITWEKTTIEKIGNNVETIEYALEVERDCIYLELMLEYLKDNTCLTEQARNKALDYFLCKTTSSNHFRTTLKEDTMIAKVLSDKELSAENYALLKHSLR